LTSYFPTIHHRAYLSLGSNLGEKAENLRLARKELTRRGLYIQKASSLYKTEPVDYLAQDWFLNQGLQAGTNFAPDQLLDCCLQVETHLGRERRVVKGPRLIDIDILLYDETIIKSARLEIPHPRMHLRRFVLEPLAAIAPSAFHPLLKKTVSALLRDCQDSSVVLKLAD
jgi:2-amino-4-hydroxy-6-hydroxymethyldihydropteridine diphosphokinase